MTKLLNIKNLRLSYFCSIMATLNLLISIDIDQFDFLLGLIREVIKNIQNKQNLG